MDDQLLSEFCEQAFPDTAEFPGGTRPLIKLVLRLLAAAGVPVPLLLTTVADAVAEEFAAGKNVREVFKAVFARFLAGEFDLETPKPKKRGASRG